MGKLVGSRKQWTEAEGLAFVAAWRKSGMAQRRFAASCGVTYSRLQYWLRRAAVLWDVGEQDVRFVEAQVASSRDLEARSFSAITSVLLPGGVSVELPAGAMQSDLEMVLRATTVVIPCG